MTAAALMNNYGPPPVTFARGAGAELWDDEGKRYLDFLCGLAVTSLGHAHPAVTAALSGQAGVLIHTSNLFANEPTADVVRILDRLMRAQAPPQPGPGGDADDHGSGSGSAASDRAGHDSGRAAPADYGAVGEPGRILFQNSGAEAVEAALKLVRKHHGRGRHAVVSAYGSFHGRTLAALAATGRPSKHEPFQPLPEGFRHVAFNDIDALVGALDPTVGAVLLESVQGEGGVNPADDGYLVAVRRVCDERGILLVMDEIQTGMARTGQWFGYQHAGIQPDIVTAAKALGNGVPVAAVWARPEVGAAFAPGDHGSTFAGQPLALAAVRAVLEVMTAMDAPAVARRLGAALTGMLQGLDGVEHVRGRGLLLGAEISEEARAGRTAQQLALACLRRGLVVNGVTGTALRFAPPLVTTEDQLAEGVAIVADALEER